MQTTHEPLDEVPGCDECQSTDDVRELPEGERLCQRCRYEAPRRAVDAAMLRGGL
jgi:hypothetical protein